MNELLDRLKSLGLIVPKSEVKTCKKNQSPLLEDIYDGTWISNSLGKVFCMESKVLYGSDFGIVNFRNDFSTKGIINLLGLDFSKIFPLERIVFIDVETTNLSIGAGSFAFLIGLCFFSKNEIHTSLLFIEDPMDEPALLNYLDDQLSNFDVISSYNGKSFDIPLIRNRFIMHKIKPISLQKMHIDLLHVSRKIWKARLRNCRLADIEREILKYTRADTEIPGWLIPQLYFDFLKQKNPSSLEGVFYHNKIDVVSLAALFQYITLILDGNKSEENLEGLDLASLGKIFNKLGQKELSQNYYDLGLKKGIDDKNAAEVHRAVGLLKKKNHEWEEAILHWELATNYNDIESCIELAKYFEHKGKIYGLALKWVKKAESILDQTHTENNAKFKIKKNLLHRKIRLIRKMHTSER